MSMNDDLADEMRARRALLDELEQALDDLNELERRFNSAMDEIAGGREQMSRLAQLRPQFGTDALRELEINADLRRLNLSAQKGKAADLSTDGPQGPIYPK